MEFLNWLFWFVWGAWLGAFVFWCKRYIDYRKHKDINHSIKLLNSVIMMLITSLIMCLIGIIKGML